MRSKKERGSAILELGLGIGMIALLLAGVIGYGPMLYNSIEISDAARAGAVYGVSNPGDFTGMQNVAVASAVNVTGVTATATQTCQCQGTTGSVSCTSTCSGGAPPMIYVSVGVQANTTPVFPDPLNAGTVFSIKRTVTMRAK